jgi:hypothetical protein
MRNMTTTTDRVRQQLDSQPGSAAKAREALLNKIDRLAGASNSPAALLQLAEAYAYLVSPESPHGPAFRVGS